MKFQKTIPQIVVLIVVLGMLVPVNVVGQPPPSPGGIESVSPTYANQGDTGVLVTITLAEQGAPPSQVVPLSMIIGTLAGDEINRKGLTVTAVFDISADEPTGMKDVSVEFPAPRGNVTFTNSEAFEIRSGQLPPPPSGGSDYVIVDTGQDKCYNNSAEITPPEPPGKPFYGQDAQYDGNQPSYTDNGDGTITDNITGLMWQKSPDRNADGVIDYSDKLYYSEAVDSAASFNLAGYNDWRLPTIKELYSIIMFSGADLNPQATSGTTPFIDTDYFDFGYGDLSAGERIIDAQYASSTIYVSTTMNGNRTMFGVNFADGRIKGYPADQTIGKKYYVLYVRGNTNYGINQFVDNGDGTITDNATGLMWMKDDNGEGVLWENALSYAEGFEYAGYTDWRLPDAKELQSIVDYTRSPATTSSAAIDPLFNCTQITNEGGEKDYPFYWTSTTHVGGSSPTSNATDANYVCFGRALGYMQGGPQGSGWVDVHGAGAQRSDPKTGDPNDYPNGRGPQGDAVRIYNYVRLVRNVGTVLVPEAKFGFTPVCPTVGQTVQFVDSSTNSPTSWHWNFGDGETSTLQNPSHVFNMAGTFTVILTVSNSAGSDSISHSITVVEAQTDTTYKIVDTGQTKFYNNTTEITAPSEGEAFYGQDPQYSGNQPSYTDNGDGTITDNVTGLMWQQSADMNGDGEINADDQMYYGDALDGAGSFNLGGYTDWRLPTLKELFSLCFFNGITPHPEGTGDDGTPFIDTDYFEFGWGDVSAGDRIIDAQYATSTLNAFNSNQMYGVNFADGHIKGYPAETGIKKYYVKYVRGNTSYGVNNFIDNGDGTITDAATGLMWSQDDSGEGFLWEDALSYAENSEYAGYNDWRLPDIKELHSIVDYTRSPQATGTAAIDPLFNCTQITNEAGDTDYPFFWTGTTILGINPSGEVDASEGVYICFGRGLGYVQNRWDDVHGAGAQRSDPKTGDPNDYPEGRGPQGDAVRIYNYVRCVRGGLSEGPTLSVPAEPSEDYSNTFFMSLTPGLNMISLPLKPITPYTARSFAEELSATAVIKLDETRQRFMGFTLDAPGDGFAIEGGKGYIVNVPESRVVAFTGTTWENEPPVEIAPAITQSDAWAFVVSGSVLDGDGINARDGSYTVTVKSLRTGATVSEVVDSSGYFAAVWADLNRKAVIEAGDKVELAVLDSNGNIASGPFVREITLDNIRDAWVKVPLKLGHIIPEKSALLQNYPNPFNPETWIPFHLNNQAYVSIRIYNATGQLIRTLELGRQAAGVYVSRSKAAYWDGKNGAGERVSSGVYFYTIRAGDFSATRKMLIVK